MSHKYRKAPRGLGVAGKDKSVLLFHQETDLRVDISSDGFNFSSYGEEPVIKRKNGKRENAKDCSDFRISKLDKNYLLVYRLKTKKETCLCGALSKDLVHWEKIGKFSEIKETGVVVPDYKCDGEFVLYFGKKSIRIAFSKDFKTWRILKKPLLRLSGELLREDSSAKMGNVIITDEGILLIYYLIKGKKKSAKYSIRAVLFDKKDPEEPLWWSDRIIWQQAESQEPINPIGVIKRDDKLISYWQAESGAIFALSHPYLKLLQQDLKQPLLSLIFKKFRENPILKPVAENAWESKLVLNPAAIYEEGKVHIIYRAVGDKNVSVFGYAASKDGIHIDERLKSPVYVFREPFETNSQAPNCRSSYISGGGSGGCEDPKLTRIGDRLYMTYVAWDGSSPPRVALTSIKIDDFLNRKWNWERPVSISPPGEMHKNWAIFPEKINGKYAVLHSLSPEILIDYVDSLEFDGNTHINSHYHPLGRKNCWDNYVRGVGPPPIKTEEGWLVLYHAMNNRDLGRYKLGAMILDLKTPTKTLCRSRAPLLEPDKLYENKGFKPGVVYACGAVVIDDRLFVYYGGADTVVCVAHTRLSLLLNQLKNQEHIQLETEVSDYDLN